MSTAVFESMVGDNFRVSDAPKISPNAQKTELSGFKDLVKDKSYIRSQNDLNLKVKTVSAKKENESRDSTQQNTIQNSEKIESLEAVIEDGLVGAEESLILPVFVDQLVPEEAEVVTVEETFTDEYLEDVEELIVPVNIDIKQEIEIFDARLEADVPLAGFEGEGVVEQSPVTHVLDSGEVLQTSADNVVLVDTTIAKQEQVLDIEKSTLAIPLNLSELPVEEQALHQNLKALFLPQKSESEVLTSDIDLIDPRVIRVDSGEDLKKLDDLIKKLDAPVKVQVESAILATSETKPVIIPSFNLALADTTRHGNAVLSRMQMTNDANEAENAVALGMDDIIDTETLFTDFGNKNDKSSLGSLSLSSFGGTMQRVSDETFNISFKGQNTSSQHEMPKPAMQISLAANEVLNSSSIDGKKQITINLHPQTLGAIKVEILSQTGHDGASKIENIKISAEKHATLIMLEERKADLASSLKEVTSTKEEASLHFEMSQDQGKGQAAYFESLEERNSWMSQFVGLVADDEGQMTHVVDEYATRGIITEDKVDLVA